MQLFNKENIEVTLNYQELTKSAIPLLIEDEMWIKLFGDIEEKDIVDLKEKLKTLVEESRSVSELLPEKKTEKKKLISKILTLSDKVNNNELTEGIELLEEYKFNLSEINEQLDDLTFKSETLPSEVRKVNLELLTETIKGAYIDLKSTEEFMIQIELELQELRKRLRGIIKEKYDNEDRRNEIYKFLHNTLGVNEVNRLDNDILD